MPFSDFQETMTLPDYFVKKCFTPAIAQEPSKNLKICVVLPSHNEPDLEKSLRSLRSCTSPKGDVEVIVVVNHPEKSVSTIAEVSEQSCCLVKEFDHKHGTPQMRFYAIKAFDLPRKSAGVGLARQIGMDEAAYRLIRCGNPNGIIACFDADATCASNYLVELEKLWEEHPKTTACSIRYAHPTAGSEYPDSVYSGIAEYELHLRYYNQASRYIGFPFSFHTIGSSMACSGNTYIRFGGMNRHQAGEDFYFLQKIIPHGNFRELNSTCVNPSPRASTRVPFGTGRAMLKYLNSPNDGIQTYALNSFLDLIPLFSQVDGFWGMDEPSIVNCVDKLPQALRDFLILNNCSSEILRAIHNTANKQSFRKRFFLWFDAFMLLKYLNYTNEMHHSKQPVTTEAVRLANLIGMQITESESSMELLNMYREWDAQEWSPTI